MAPVETFCRLATLTKLWKRAESQLPLGRPATASTHLIPPAPMKTTLKSSPGFGAVDMVIFPILSMLIEGRRTDERRRGMPRSIGAWVDMSARVWGGGSMGVIGVRVKGCIVGGWGSVVGSGGSAARLLKKLLSMRSARRGAPAEPVERIECRSRFKDMKDEQRSAEASALSRCLLTQSAARAQRNRSERQLADGRATRSDMPK